MSEDLRVIKTRSNIRKEFLSLLEQYEFRAITVSMIIERCQINRSTFYRNYEDKYALADAIVQDLLEGAVLFDLFQGLVDGFQQLFVALGHADDVVLFLKLVLQQLNFTAVLFLVLLGGVVVDNNHVQPQVAVDQILHRQGTVGVANRLVLIGQAFRFSQAGSARLAADFQALVLDVGQRGIRTVRPDDDGLQSGVIAVGEVHGLFSVGAGGKAGGDEIDILGFQALGQGIKFDIALDLEGEIQLLRDGFDDVHVHADNLAALFVLKGREKRIGAHDQLALRNEI